MRTTHRRRTCGLTAALFCLALAGCTLPPPPPPGPPRQAALRYSRVAIVEFANRTQYPGRAEEFTQALREKLAEHTRNTDVVVVPRSLVFGDDDPFQSGRISIDALTRVRRDYLADAVIVGSLDGLDPYRPPSLQLSMKVIETARGTVAYEVSDVWNAAESRVRSGHQRLLQGQHRRGRLPLRAGHVPDLAALLHALRGRPGRR